MSNVIVQPCRLKGEPQITAPCLFWINPGEKPFVVGEAKSLQAQQHFLFNSTLFKLPGEVEAFWAGPSMGAPMAVMTLEKLIALGADKVVVYGWCGSLDKSLSIGDIYLPTWGHSEEGTSQHYQEGNREPQTSNGLRIELVAHLHGNGYKVKEGPIWTTDAPYRETKEKIRDYSSQGILAVDMELCALATVAAFRKIELAAVMLVSDELFHEEWHPGFTQKKFKQKSRAVFRELSRYLQLFD